VTTIRRIYAYLLAFIGLAMLLVATANLAQLLIDVTLRAPVANTGAYVRDTVALYAALALVGLPAWLLHWLWINRTARSHPSERASTLRRLYVYLVLAGAMLVMAVTGGEVLSRAFDGLTGVRTSDPIVDAVVRPLPFVLIAFGAWWAHVRIAAADRASVGETGGSATLRRWYLYGTAFVALLVLLSTTQSLLAIIWRAVVQPGGPADAGLGGPMAFALVGLAVWLTHWIVLPGRLPATDRRDDGVSVLRSVYLFLALAVAVVGALLGASQLLYYAVARLLGVSDPGGVGGSLVLAAAGPASLVIVYGAAWAYQRQAVRQQSAAFVEAPRQAGIRRLYAYLVALVALALLAGGVAGLLWTLGNIVFDSTATASGGSWRGQIALFATLACVGLPVWLLHWRAEPVDVQDVRSLARRLYVYLSLIAAALAGIGSLAAALYRLIGLALGGGFDFGVVTDLLHALAVAGVAAVLAAYHWRILRADAQRSQLAPADSPAATPALAPEPEPEPESDSAPKSATGASAVVEIVADDAADLDSALSALRSTGVRVTVIR